MNVQSGYSKGQYATSADTCWSASSFEAGRTAGGWVLSRRACLTRRQFKHVKTSLLTVYGVICAGFLIKLEFLACKRRMCDMLSDVTLDLGLLDLSRKLSPSKTLPTNTVFMFGIKGSTEMASLNVTLGATNGTKLREVEGYPIRPRGKQSNILAR